MSNINEKSGCSHRENPLVTLSRQCRDAHTESQERNIRTDNSMEEETAVGVPYELFTSFYEKKLEKLEKKLDTLATSVKPRTEMSFKYKGNRVQYEHNCSVLVKLQATRAEAENDQGDPELCLARINEAVSAIEERNRHVLIADSTDGGWDTVKEYVGNKEIAKNSDDEKKIRSADLRAMAKKKRKWGLRNASRSQYSERRTEEDLETKRWGYKGTGRSTFNKGSSSREDVPMSSSDRQGSCYGCGSWKYWIKNCPRRRYTKNDAYDKY